MWGTLAAILGVAGWIWALTLFLAKRLSTEELASLIEEGKEVIEEYKKAKRKESEEGEKISVDEALRIAEEATDFIQKMLKSVKE